MSFKYCLMAFININCFCSVLIKITRMVADVKKIVESCPNLIEFDVSDCTNLTSSTLEAIVSGLGNLKRLCLSRCYNMASSNFRLLETIDSLHHLELFGVLHDSVLASLTLDLENITINRSPFSTIARPTTGYHRTSLWGLRVRDCWGQSMKMKIEMPFRL